MWDTGTRFLWWDIRFQVSGIPLDSAGNFKPCFCLITIGKNLLPVISFSAASFAIGNCDDYKAFVH